MRLKFTIIKIILLVGLISLQTKAQLPELVVQGGHTRPINSIAFSPDSKLIVTSSDDAKIKLWDINAGVELRTFSGHKERIKSVIFSPDGETLASGGEDSSIKIWDVKTGKELKTIEIANSDTYLTVLAFSPDGKILASGNSTGNTSLWDVATGQEIQNFDYSDDNILQVSFSPDGKYLLSLVSKGLNGNLLKIFDLQTKQEITAPDFTRTSLAFAIAADSKTVAIAKDKTIKIWNIENGNEIITIKNQDNINNSFRSVAFTPDGKSIITSSGDKTRRIWDVQSGTQLKSFSLASDKYEFWLSPDGKIVAEGIVLRENRSTSAEPWDFAENTSPSVILSDATNGREIRMLNGQSLFYASLDISPDQKFIATNNNDQTTRIWELKSGKEIGKLKDIYENTPLIYSPDGKLIVNSGAFYRIYLWDAAGHQKIRTLEGHEGFLNSIRFSKDSKKLISCGYDQTIKIWDVANGKQLKDFQDVSLCFLAMFSPDGKKIANISLTKNLNSLFEVFLRDLETGKIEGEWVIGKDKNFSQVEKELPWFKEGLVWINNANDRFQFRLANGEDTTIERDNEKLTISSLKSGKTLCSLYLMDKNNWLVTTPDGFFDGTPLAWKQLIWRFNNNTFDYAPIETYFNDFFYPNLMQDVLAGKSPKPKAGIELEKIDRRQPKVEIESINGQIGFQTQTNQRTAKVVIKVTDNNSEKKQPNHQQTSGAQDVRLFRNGSLVKIWRGDVLKGQPNTTLETDVPIVAGENILTVYAFNASNVKSNDDIAEIEGKFSQKEGILYVFTIGVNKYANSAYNLNFAVPDVIDIGKTLEAEQTKIQTDSNLKQYKKTEIITLTDENATKNNILLALRRFSEGDKINLPANVSAQLKTELAKIKPIQPEDGLIIQFSGHGVSRDQRFYLLPHNFTDVKMLKEQGVSDIELNEVLEKVDAGRLLMIIDACQSGQALGEQNEGRAPMNSKGLAQLAYDKGMLILTAAQSQQAALEAVKIGGKIVKHGLLTYSLLEGIRNLQADQDSNQQLWQREWFDYAVEQVPRLQIEAMKQRRIDLKNGVKGRGEIIFLDGDDPKLSPEKRKVQTPRVFYRREAETKPLIMAKP